MPKVKITFNLNNYEDDEAGQLKIHLKANDMLASFRDFSNYIREEIEHTDDPNKSALIEKIRDEFYKCLEYNNIDLDELLN